MTSSECTQEDCDQPVKALGLCRRHYANAYYHRTKGKGGQMQNKGKTCLRQGCSKEAKAKGLCITHYNTGLRYRARKKESQKLREMRFGKGSAKKSPDEEKAPYRQYAYESTRWREAQEVIADYLRRLGQGQVLWAMPAWGDGARGLEKDLEAEVMIDYYCENRPKNFMPWRKQETPAHKLKPKESALTINVLRTCRTTAATIANNLRWELLKAQEVVPSPVDEDLLDYVAKQLEEWEGG